MATVRIALRDGAGRAELDALALEHGWRLANIAPRADDRPREITFVTAGAMDIIVLVEDPRAPRVEITAHDPSELAERVRAVLGARS